MVQEQISDAKGRMHKATESLRHELATVRTGRASTGLVEHIKVLHDRRQFDRKRFRDFAHRGAVLALEPREYCTPGRIDERGEGPV